MCAGSLANDALRKGEAGTGEKKGKGNMARKKNCETVFYLPHLDFSVLLKTATRFAAHLFASSRMLLQYFLAIFARCGEVKFLKKSVLSRIAKKRFPPTCLTCIFGQGFFKISAGKRSGSILTGNLGKKDWYHAYLVIIGDSKLLLLAFTQHNKNKKETKKY